MDALRTLVSALIVQRGDICELEIKPFLDAGYQLIYLMDVMVMIGQITFNNYTNHLAETPIDAVFEGRAWSPS